MIELQAEKNMECENEKCENVAISNLQLCKLFELLQLLAGASSLNFNQMWN